MNSQPSTSPEAATVMVDSVEKWYGPLHVLRGISLHVPAASRQVICGPSGSGKSTLLRCINALETVEHGSITVGNSVMTDLRGRELKSARASIGMVFQQFALYDHLSALGNVTLAPRRVRGMPKSDAEGLGRSLLKEVGLWEKADRYPPQLSGGQQQRVAIARAMAMEPTLMLFDEPTSALDPEMIGEVLEVMRRLAEGGITMIIVSHEMEFAREVADEIVFMDDGKIVETGPPEQLLKDPCEARTRQFLSRILSSNGNNGVGG